MIKDLVKFIKRLLHLDNKKKLTDKEVNTMYIHVNIFTLVRLINIKKSFSSKYLLKAPLFEENLTERSCFCDTDLILAKISSN